MKKIDMSLPPQMRAAPLSLRPQVRSPPVQQEVTLEQYQILLQEFNRRFGQTTTAKASFKDKLKLLEKRALGLLPSQMAFRNDPKRRKAAQCDRQAGKTFVLQQMLLEYAVKYDNVVIPYIALTLDHARDLMWEPIKQIATELGMEDDFDFNESLLTCRLPNGTRIKMIGADSPRHIRRLRGYQFPFVAIDEAGEMGAHFDELIEAIIEPALMRYRGTLALIGTPGPICDGIFYDITHADNPPESWGVHHWTFLDNIHLPAEERDLELILSRHPGWTRETPRFQREYLGKWVADTGGMVYHYDEQKNHWDGKLPVGHDWIFGCGVDFGWNDATAFVVIAFSPTCENVYVVEEFKAPKMLPEAISSKLLSLQAAYGQLLFVADPGGGGKRIIEEMNSRFGLGMKVAEKPHKYDFIELLNSDLYLGRVKIDKDSALATEMRRLPWSPDKLTTGKFIEHPGFKNDLCDAHLYIYRESKHWAGREPRADILDGTPLAEQSMKEKQLDAALFAVREREHNEFYGFDGNG